METRKLCNAACSLLWFESVYGALLHINSKKHHLAPVRSLIPLWTVVQSRKGISPSSVWLRLKRRWPVKKICSKNIENAEIFFNDNKTRKTFNSFSEMASKVTLLKFRIKRALESYLKVTQVDKRRDDQRLFTFIDWLL